MVVSFESEPDFEVAEATRPTTAIAAQIAITMQIIIVVLFFFWGIGLPFSSSLTAFAFFWRCFFSFWEAHPAVAKPAFRGGV